MSADARTGSAARPRLRDSIIVVQLADGRLQFRATYERVVSTFSVEPWVADLVPLAFRLIGAEPPTLSPSPRTGERSTT